jgi:hypothetical protein
MIAPLRRALRIWGKTGPDPAGKTKRVNQC